MSKNVRKLLFIPHSLSARRILGKLGLQQNVQKRVVVGHRLENRQSLIIKCVTLTFYRLYNTDHSLWSTQH